MRKYIKLAILPALILLDHSANAADFTKEQKEEIGKIVQEYIVANPEVITQAIVALQNKEMQAWVEKGKEAVKANLDDVFNSKSPNNGVSKPTVSVVEFFDYNCKHCKVMHGVLANAQSTNKNVQIIYKELPVLSEASLLAAKAALAAREQNKYLPLHAKLMEYNGALTEETIFSLAKEAGLDVDKLKKDMSSPKVEEELQANRKIAMSIGLRGTPTFIIGKSPATKEMDIDIIAGEIKPDELQNKINKSK